MEKRKCKAFAFFLDTASVVNRMQLKIIRRCSRLWGLSNSRELGRTVDVGCRLAREGGGRRRRGLAPVCGPGGGEWATMMMWRSLDQQALGDVPAAAMRRGVGRRTPARETQPIPSPAASGPEEVATSGPDRGDDRG